MPGRRHTLLLRLCCTAASLLVLPAASAAAAAASGAQCVCTDRCAPDDHPLYATHTASSGEASCVRHHYREPLAWDDAQVACGRDGGRLVEDASYLASYTGEADVWVGARVAAAASSSSSSSPDRMVWNSSGSAVPASLRRGVHHAGAGACGFFNPPYVYRFFCDDTLGFLCEAPLVSFQAGVHQASAAAAAGVALGAAANLTVVLRTSSPLLQATLASLRFATSTTGCSESAATAALSPAAAVSAAGAATWTAPGRLQAGRRYSLCWARAGTAALHATGVEVPVLPLPQLDAQAFALPAATLPRALRLAGAHLAADAVAGLFEDATCTRAAKAPGGAAVSAPAGGDVTIPLGMPVREYFVCVAAWGGGAADDAASPAFRGAAGAGARVVVQPEPSFSPENVYAPHAFALAEGKIAVRGSDLDQDFVWLALSLTSACLGTGVAAPPAVLGRDGYYTVPKASLAHVGRPLYLCYAVAAGGAVPPPSSVVYRYTGVSVNVTPQPGVSLTPTQTLNSSYAEAAAGAAVTLAGLNFKTRGSPSMLYVATSPQADCGAPLTRGGQITGTTTTGAGRAAPHTTGGDVHVCIVAAVNDTAEPVAVYPTAVTLSLAPPPSFAAAEVWVSAQPALLPSGNNTERTAGMWYALATERTCSSPTASAEGRMPVVPTPQGEAAAYHLCWGVGGAAWTPTDVVLRFLPSAAVVAASSHQRLPHNAYGAARSVAVTGRYMREAELLWVRSAADAPCGGSPAVAARAAFACEPWCASQPAVVPADLAGGATYALCVALGPAHARAAPVFSGARVTVVAAPATTAQAVTWSLKEYFAGGTVTVAGANLEFMFTTLAKGDSPAACDAVAPAQPSGPHTAFSGVLTVPASDAALGPGETTQACYARGVDAPATAWAALNVSVTVQDPPRFDAATLRPTPLEVWGGAEPHVVQLAGSGLQQPLLLSLCETAACTGCAPAARTQTAAVPLPFELARSHSTAGRILHVCWAVEAEYAKVNTGCTVHAPALFPAAPRSVSLLYGDVESGIRLDVGVAAAGLWGALARTGGEGVVLSAPWQALTGGVLASALASGSADAAHTLLLTYGGRTERAVETAVSVSWRGAPVFPFASFTLTLRELVGGGGVLNFSSQGGARNLGAGAGIRVGVGGCGGAPATLLFDAAAVSADGAAALPALRRVEELAGGGRHPLCWAAADSSGSATAWHEAKGVTVLTPSNVPVLTPGSLKVGRVARLGSRAVSVSVAGRHLAPAGGLHAFVAADAAGCAVAPAGEGGSVVLMSPAADGAAAAVPLPAAVVGSFANNSVLCWSAFEDGRHGQAGGGVVLHTPADPVFAPGSATVVPVDVAAGKVELRFAARASDDVAGIAVTVVRGEGCGGDVVLGPHLAPGTRFALPQPPPARPLRSEVLHACWFATTATTDAGAAEAANVLQAPTRVVGWSVVLANFPEVRLVAGVPLPFKASTFSNTQRLAVAGANLDAAKFALVKVADGCGSAAAAQALPLAVAGLTGPYTLCVSLSGQTATFGAVEGIDAGGILLVAPEDTPVPEVTPAPPTPVPKTDVPKVCHTASELGVMSALACFGGGLNQAGRLVGCLSAGGTNPACMAQYERCNRDLVEGCPDGSEYTEVSRQAGVTFNVDYDDFDADVFRAVVAAEVRALPWLVEVVSVQRGSVTVVFVIRGPKGTAQLSALQASLDAGDNPFLLVNWTVVATPTPAPPVAPPVTSAPNSTDAAPEDDANTLEEVVVPALLVVALVVCVLLTIGVGAGHRYLRVVDEVCVEDLVIPSPPPPVFYEEDGGVVGGVGGDAAPVVTPPDVALALAHVSGQQVQASSPATLTPLPHERPLPRVPGQEVAPPVMP